MKNIITAIGNEETNNLLKTQKDIRIKSQDIQYQEGIFEALDKYKEIDGIILHEEIVGELELEELIRSIIMIKNEIEIILITSKEEKFKEDANIIKIVNNNLDYVKEVFQYLCGGFYIKPKCETIIQYSKDEKGYIQKDNNENSRIKIEKRKQTKTLLEMIKDKLLRIIKKQKKSSKLITVIGSSGVRQNVIYFNIIKTNQKQKDTNHRF